MFQFPWFPLPALYIQTGMTRHDPCRVFLFGDPRIEACLAAPRGLSQPATSFIGFQRLDIHRVPFATCRNDARAHYGVLKVRGSGPAAPARTRRVVRCIGPEGAYETQPSKLHRVPALARCTISAGHNLPQHLRVSADVCGPPGGGRIHAKRLASDPQKLDDCRRRCVVGLHPQAP